MTRDEIQITLLAVREAYQQSLDGKAVSFTGANGRSVTNHDPRSIRDELEYWESRWRKINRRGAGYSLANFGR